MQSISTKKAAPLVQIIHNWRKFHIRISSLGSFRYVIRYQVLETMKVQSQIRNTFSSYSIIDKELLPDGNVISALGL